MYAALGFDVNNHWVLQFKSSPGARQLLPRHKSTVPLVLVNSTQSLKVQFSIPPHQTQLPSTDPEATNPNGLSPNPQMNYVSIAFSIEVRMFIPLSDWCCPTMNYSQSSLGIQEQALVPVIMKRVMVVQCVVISNISAIIIHTLISRELVFPW